MEKSTLGRVCNLLNSCLTIAKDQSIAFSLLILALPEKVPHKHEFSCIPGPIPCGLGSSNRGEQVVFASIQLGPSAPTAILQSTGTTALFLVGSEHFHLSTD